MKVISVEENEFVLYLVRKFVGNGKFVWIGLYYYVFFCVYYWIDNLVLIYVNWVLKEFNGYFKKLCVVMYIGLLYFFMWVIGYWNDILCIVKYNIVCKRLV